VFLQLYINLASGLLQTKYQTIGDHYNEGHAVIENHVFDSICMLYPDRRRECQGHYPSFEGQLHSLE